MTVNYVTAALFRRHALKLSFEIVIWWSFLTTNQILCFPYIERRSHIRREISGLSAVKTTPSLACLVRNSWE